MIFTKILQKMLKQDLTLEIMNQNSIPLKGRLRDELGGKIMIVT